MARDGDDEAALRALREENEALRYASLKFGELSERLSQRVRELERRLELYQRPRAEQVRESHTPRSAGPWVTRAGG